MQELTDEVVRALAAANGIVIPAERLELVRRQYQEYLRTLADLEKLPLAPEAEPSSITPAIAGVTGEVPKHG